MLLSQKEDCKLINDINKYDLEGDTQLTIACNDCNLNSVKNILNLFLF